MLLTFGEKSRQERLNQKLTQATVAEMANMNEKHYSRIEKNNCYPRIDTLLDICNALKIDLNILFK